MGKALLTKAQIERILHAYANEGGKAARILGMQYGITASHVRKLGSLHGIKVKPRERSPRYNRRPKMYMDPRWERAKAIGPVIA